MLARQGRRQGQRGGPLQSKAFPRASRGLLVGPVEEEVVRGDAGGSCHGLPGGRRARAAARTETPECRGACLKPVSQRAWVGPSPWFQGSPKSFDSGCDDFRRSLGAWVSEFRVLGFGSRAWAKSRVITSAASAFGTHQGERCDSSCGLQSEGSG